MTGARHRIGIIGSGDIANAHVRGYHAAGAEVVAICDVNAEALARRQRDWNIALGFTSADELLALDDLTAVSICTPNATHHPITIAAARAGKHVLCEKPVSLEPRQGLEMIEACATAGVVLQVGHHLRSWRAAAMAKSIIESGAIGELTFARFRQAHDWGGRPEVRGVFGSKADSGGGTLLDNGCHLFDLSRYFGGDVRDVHARIATLRFPIEVEDTAIATLGYRSGAMGSIEVGWTATGYHEGFWLFGTQGSLECDSRTGASVLIHRFRSAGAPVGDTTDIVRHEINGVSAHVDHVANFLAAIEGSRPVICTGEDGLEAVKLVLACYQSAESGQPVEIDRLAISS
jgi:predicted dehydrogenase